MASNTPNLNLLKKDPIADANSNFDIKTMLNENWDKIDTSVNTIATSMADIVQQNNFYDLNNMKNKRVMPLSFVSDTAHFSIFTGAKACNGILTADMDGNSGWLLEATYLAQNLSKFSMPIGVVVGDSIMEGHPNTHGRLDPLDLNKPNEIGQISYHIEQNAKIKIYNHGIGGQRLDEIRARWHRDVLAQTDEGLTPTSTLPKKPIFVVIGTGINDVFLPRTYAQMIADMEYMIDSAISNNIYPIVFNCGTHYYMDSTKLTLVKQYNSWLVEKARQTPNMTLIDFYTYTNDPNNDGHPKDGVFADTVHPTKTTYEDLARKIIVEAFVKSKPPVVPKYINISTAMNIDLAISGANRPTSLLLYINDIPVKYVELINDPNQVIEIPSVKGYIDTIAIEPIIIEAPYEFPSNTATYGYVSEVYLSDENIYPNNIVDRYKSIIKVLPSVNSITKYYPVQPDGTTPGKFTFLSAVGATNCIGVYCTVSSNDIGYVATKGLAVCITTEAPVYDGDFLITSTANNFIRSASPTAGTVVAKVVKAGAVYSLIDIL